MVQQYQQYQQNITELILKFDKIRTKNTLKNIIMCEAVKSSMENILNQKNNHNILPPSELKSQGSQLAYLLNIKYLLTSSSYNLNIKDILVIIPYLSSPYVLSI
jgi:hypothetical protein